MLDDVSSNANPDGEFKESPEEAVLLSETKAGVEAKVDSPSSLSDKLRLAIQHETPHGPPWLSLIPSPPPRSLLSLDPHRPSLTPATRHVKPTPNCAATTQFIICSAHTLTTNFVIVGTISSLLPFHFQFSTGWNQGPMHTSRYWSVFLPMCMHMRNQDENTVEEHAICCGVKCTSASRPKDLTNTNTNQHQPKTQTHIL